MAKESKTTSSAVEAVAEGLSKSLEEFARTLSKPLTEKALPVAHAAAARMRKAVSSIEDLLKAQVKVMVLAKGSPVGENGSKALIIGNYRMEVRANGSNSFDETRALALLKSKTYPNGKPLNIDEYTEKEVTYHVDFNKVQQLIGAKVLTEKELQSCKKDVTYAVQSTTRIEQES
jgi:hypothetical protein